MTSVCRIGALAGALVVALPLYAQEAAPAEVPADIDLSQGQPSSSLPQALRFTVGHEASLRAAGAPRVANNRSWFRAEYSQFFLDSFFVQLDTKVNGFWAVDHRARAEGRQALFESSTQEAFVQYSAAGGQTSVKAGIGRLIWGESEAGAITDEVSPRNFSELFLIPLEESRIGQFMFNLDHFSEMGNWSFFFIPKPKLNRYPKLGTAYYLDPFNGGADIRAGATGEKLHEYGMRWKRTFGKSDISLMAASLIDNDAVLRADGVDAGGRLLFTSLKQRFTLTGMTFNYALGHFLVKGEAGLKSPKRFHDGGFNIVEKDVVDSSLGLTYSLGQSNTVGLELVNSHVRKWQDGIAEVPRDTRALVLNTNFFFLHDTLAVNWLTIRNRPYTGYQSSLRTSYKWNDNTTFSVDAHLVDAPDRKSGLYEYRRQDQIVFRVQYHF